MTVKQHSGQPHLNAASSFMLPPFSSSLIKKTNNKRISKTGNNQTASVHFRLHFLLHQNNTHPYLQQNNLKCLCVTEDTTTTTTTTTNTSTTSPPSFPPWPQSLPRRPHTMGHILSNFMHKQRIFSWASTWIFKRLWPCFSSITVVGLKNC